MAGSDGQNPKSNEIFIDKKGKIKNKNEEIKTGALDAGHFLSRSVGCVGWQGKKKEIYQLAWLAVIESKKGNRPITKLFS